MRNGVSGFGLLVAVLAAMPAHADHHIGLAWSGDLGVGYDDNVGNATDSDDVVDDTLISAGLNLDFHWKPTLFTSLLLRSSLRGDGFDDADGLSSAKLVEMVRVSHRPAGGFYTPTLAAWVSAGLWEFDSAMRDGAEYRGGVYIAEPITTTISMRLGASVSERASDSYVFDLSTWAATLDFDWQVLPQLTVYTGYQFSDGDIVSTGTALPKASHLAGGCGGASACDADDALDGQFAYRVDAKTHVATLGFNVPLSPRFSLDVQLRHADSESDGGDGYDRFQGIVSALTRF